jgi:hypothetical protein
MFLLMYIRGLSKKLVSMGVIKSEVNIKNTLFECIPVHELRQK